MRRTGAGGKGAFAALDCVGGEGAAAVSSSVRERGTLILWGAMAGFQTTLFIPDIVFRHVRVRLGAFTARTLSSGVFNDLHLTTDLQLATVLHIF